MRESVCVHKGGWETGNEYPTSSGLLSHSAGCRKSVKKKLILFIQHSRILPRYFLLSNKACFLPLALFLTSEGRSEPGYPSLSHPTPPFPQMCPNESDS